jgi:hypothetical protein
MDARCHHCGRAVRPTVHLRGGALVDYFRMHTGPTEPAVIEDRDGRGSIHFDRLLTPQEILTCRDCFALPQVVAFLEEAWARGLSGARREAPSALTVGRASVRYF